MTHYQYRRALEKELEDLNRKIDLKIVWGRGYSDDSRRHRMLREQVKRLKRERFVSSFKRLIPLFR